MTKLVPKFVSYDKVENPLNKSLSEEFSTAESDSQYVIRLIDQYGASLLKRQEYYPPELKKEI